MKEQHLLWRRVSALILLLLYVFVLSGNGRYSLSRKLVAEVVGFECEGHGCACDAVGYCRANCACDPDAEKQLSSCCDVEPEQSSCCGGTACAEQESEENFTEQACVKSVGCGLAQSDQYSLPIHLTPPPVLLSVVSVKLAQQLTLREPVFFLQYCYFPVAKVPLSC